MEKFSRFIIRWSDRFAILSCSHFTTSHSSMCKYLANLGHHLEKRVFVHDEPLWLQIALDQFKWQAPNWKVDEVILLNVWVICMRIDVCILWCFPRFFWWFLLVQEERWIFFTLLGFAGHRVFRNLLPKCFYFVILQLVWPFLTSNSKWSYGRYNFLKYKT